MHGLVVSVRGLGEAFLQQKISARLIVRSAARHFFRIREESLLVVLLKPRERSIEKRVAAKTRRIVCDLLETLRCLIEMPRQILDPRRQKVDPLRPCRLRMKRECFI